MHPHAMPTRHFDDMHGMLLNEREMLVVLPLGYYAL
jgi:hypothetical protein